MFAPYERKINYYETDQMAIVHHSNYVRYMEECRMYYMEQYGIPYEEIERQGILIPVLGVQVAYKKALRYGDTIVITQSITKFTPVKFSLQYEITNRETGELHATAVSEHCFVDSKLAPVRLKKEFPEIYEKMKKIAEWDQRESKSK